MSTFSIMLPFLLAATVTTTPFMTPEKDITHESCEQELKELQEENESLRDQIDELEEMISEAKSALGV